MFTERILETVEKPVVFAEQKMTVPTERLLRALKASESLGLSLINLTYLGVPFVDPARGDFNLFKPRILTSEGLQTLSINASRAYLVRDGSTESGLSLTDFYRSASRLRSTAWNLSLGQIAWLLDPQELDMTDFYLDCAGLSEPTRDSISAGYLPDYYRCLGEAGIPAVAGYDRLPAFSKRLIRDFEVQIIDLPDFNPELNFPTSRNFSQRSYVDLSEVDQNSVVQLFSLS